MNKQEAIEKIEELKKYSCGALGDDWISLGIDKALNVVKQLDEPEKVVLTKEEAEWVEGLKKEQERRTFWTKYSMLYFITRCGFGYGFSYDHEDREVELKHYSHEVHAEKERLANAILYGYEIEEEKLYTVKFANEDFGKMYIGIFKKFNKLGISSLPLNNDEAKSWFTEDELKRFKFWNNPAFEVDEVKE